MAKVTCKCFTYAKYSSGGDGNAISYTGGNMLDDYLAKCEITEERSDEREYADGHLIDSEKIPVAARMVMELVNNNSAIKKDVLGLKEISNELVLTEADPAIVGAGCLMANRYKGVVTWEGYWLYKTMFSHQGVSAETRRDRTTFQHDTIEGTAMAVKFSSDGDVCYYAHKDGLTEANAIAWLKEHAGIQAVVNGGGGSNTGGGT